MKINILKQHCTKQKTTSFYLSTSIHLMAKVMPRFMSSWNHPCHKYLHKEEGTRHNPPSPTPSILPVSPLSPTHPSLLFPLTAWQQKVTGILYRTENRGVGGQYSIFRRDQHWNVTWLLPSQEHVLTHHRFVLSTNGQQCTWNLMNGLENLGNQKATEPCSYNPD